MTIKQCINNNRTTALERTATLATRGLDAFYWRQIFSLDSVIVKTQKIFSSHRGFLANAKHHHRETIKSNYYTIMKQKRAHDSQIVRAKENPKLIHSGPSQRQAPDTNQWIKGLIQGHH